MKRFCAAVASIGLLLACSTGPEEAILQHFFAAARLHDTTALGGLATTSFDPAEQGIVTSFAITAVSPEQRRPLPAGALAGTPDGAVAALSADDPRHPIDLARYPVEIVTRQVTLTAPVRLADGRTPQKTLVVTMERAVVKGDREVAGRWIITAIADGADRQG